MNIVKRQKSTAMWQTVTLKANEQHKRWLIKPEFRGNVSAMKLPPSEPTNLLSGGTATLKAQKNPLAPRNRNFA